jgi:hypothetical protein
MLHSLHLSNVGPAPEMEMALGSRLNLITGDNGLGKSFLLDVAWWALTRKWPQELNPGLASGYPARPTLRNQPASIGFSLSSRSKDVSYRSKYVARDEAWTGRTGRPWNPGLVIYALGDGGFAVWDPARNYWRTGGRADVHQRFPAYVFSGPDVWDGLNLEVDGKRTRVCNGLVADCATWIREGGQDLKRMETALGLLLEPAEAGHARRPRQLSLFGPGFARLSLDDVRDIPTLRMSYEQDVPIVYASLGIRRVAGLAYMLSWAWREHLIAAEQLGEAPTTSVVMLFDELEAHLHPRWQRAIVPALLAVVRALTEIDRASVQLLAATHSPLVLASVEPHFEPETDRLFNLQLRDGEVALRELPWAKQGDVLNWLVSESFGLVQARSTEAERAIEAAEAWMRGARKDLPPGLTTRPQIHGALVSLLPGHDPFWPRWVVSSERRGKTSKRGGKKRK